MKIILYFCIYFLVNIYIIFNLRKWLNYVIKNKWVKRVIKGIYLGIFVIPFVTFFFDIPYIHTILYQISNIYIAALVYIVGIMLLLKLLGIILVKCFKVKRSIILSKKYQVIMMLVLIISVSTIVTYGNIHISDIQIVNYDVNIAKESNISNLKIALISDTHLGYTIGENQMNKMAKMINDENVDLLLIAGDIFDNSADTMDNKESCIKALKSINTKYGKYAIYGNHDIYEKLFAGFSYRNIDDDFRTSSMDNFLQEADIKLIDDSYELIEDSFYIVGRRDYLKSGFGDLKRKELDELTKNIDFTKPVIMLDHEPNKLKEEADSNIDLLLAGHTHNGQYFPINLGVSLIYPNPYGLKKIDNMTSIVTSGIGVYGPPIRFGTDSEIVILNVNFKNE